MPTTTKQRRESYCNNTVILLLVSAALLSAVAFFVIYARMMWETSQIASLLLTQRQQGGQIENLRLTMADVMSNVNSIGQWVPYRFDGVSFVYPAGWNVIPEKNRICMSSGSMLFAPKENSTPSGSYLTAGMQVCFQSAWPSSISMADLLETQYTGVKKFPVNPYFSKEDKFYVNLGRSPIVVTFEQQRFSGNSQMIEESILASLRE